MTEATAESLTPEQQKLRDELDLEIYRQRMRKARGISSSMKGRRDKKTTARYLIATIKTALAEAPARKFNNEDSEESAT